MSDFRETLYTVDSDGNRRWVYAAAAKGRFFLRRRVVSTILLLIYLSLPWIVVNGHQAVLLDILNRKFIFFGVIFWASDSYFLLLILGGLGISLFLFTELFGRVWCGWACPETVFLEFVFRPIEAWIEGSPSQRKHLDQSPWTWTKIRKKGAKYLVFAVIAWCLASTLLAYFVGREVLFGMMSDWPLNNPVPFAVTVLLMGALLFQFGWFREQFCTVLCPYARFQSVLMDVDSLLVGYDQKRGEPRTKLKVVDTQGEQGDCVDCGMCVRVCPTGIDIRNGTQLECVHCAACIDACDSIMDKVGRPRGLIRYDSERRLRRSPGSSRRVRAMLYGVLFVGYIGAFVYLLANRETSEVQLIRAVGGSVFTELTDGRLSNQLKLHVSNKAEEARKYRVTVLEAPTVEAVVPLDPFPVGAGETASVPVFVNFPRELLHTGKFAVKIEVSDERGYKAVHTVNLLGPDENSLR